MFQAMIVEDNAIYRYAVKSILCWEDYGFEIIAEALNGRHALELLQERRVDLILTDISMPEMNGIDFIQAVKRIDPSIHIVAISSYDDFQFVKEALKLGADDYLLKHELETDTLRVLLEQMHTRIIEDRRKKQEEGYIQSNMTAMMTMLGKKLLLGEITNGQEIDKQAMVVHLPMINKPTVVITAVKAQSTEEDNSRQGQWSRTVEASLSQLADDAMSLMVIPISERRICVIAYFLNEKSETYISSNAYLAGSLMLSAQQRSDTAATIGISAIGGGIKDLHTLYMQSEEALTHSIYEGSGKIYRYNTMPQFVDTNLVDDARINLLSAAMKHGKLAEVEKQTELLFSYLQEHQPSISELRQVLVDLFALLKFLATEKNVLQAQMKHWHMDLIHAIEYLQPIQQIKRLFLDMCRQLLGNALDKQPSRKEIQLVMDYIHAHYAEDITIAELSNVLNFSTNYLSNLFKQETGIRIVEYINRYRIDMATFLLRNPTLKVYEVAERTGFQDTSYFCKVFKEIEGITVTEYKRQVNHF